MLGHPNRKLRMIPNISEFIRKYFSVYQQVTGIPKLFFAPNMFFPVFSCSSEKYCITFALVKPKDVRQPLG